ncbi:type I restriction enzyme S subunit [Bradyrhizobium sp. USDA 4354]
MASSNHDASVGDYVTLVRGTTYKGTLVGQPGPALLGLGSIEPGGGFRIGDYKTYGGECPAELMLFPGDLYASLKGATKDGKMIGSVARVPTSVPTGRLTQDTVKLVFRSPNPKDVSYLHWILRTPQYREYCAGHAMGSAVVALSRRDFLSYPVPPPTVERRRATALLDAIEERIELNRRMNETLEEIARAIFKSWFVDFDPVRASIEKRRAASASPTRDVFPNSFERCVAGNIPTGWRSTVWGELVSLEYGKSLSGYSGSTSVYPVFGTNGKIGTYDKPLCSHPGIIIGRKGAYRGIHYCSTPFFVIDTAFYVEPRGPMEMRWAYYELLRNDINSMDSGSAIPSTSREDFYRLPVVAPPIQVQQAFTRVLEANWLRQEANERQSQTLAALRDTLLPKLISGELRVKAAEKIVEAVA